MPGEQVLDGRMQAYGPRHAHERFIEQAGGTSTHLT
jgi:hypothetical protein